MMVYGKTSIELLLKKYPEGNPLKTPWLSEPLGMAATLSAWLAWTWTRRAPKAPGRHRGQWSPPQTWGQWIPTIHGFVMG